MKIHKAAIASLMALGVAAAGTASAQSYDQQFTQQLDSIRGSVSSGQSGGKITSAQATQFNSRLNNINDLKAQYAASDNQITASEYTNLKQRLDVINDDVNRTLRGGIQTGGNEGPAASASYDQQLNEQMNRIRSQISSGQQSGALTATQVQSLNSRLDNINGLRQQYLGDGLTAGEYNNVKQRLDVIADDVRRQGRTG